MYQTLTRYLVIGTAILSLAACGGSNRSSTPMPPEPAPPAETPTQTFHVVITNLSAAQPFSPIAVVLHDSGYRGWTLGDPASDGLEQLAEGGDNATFLVINGAMLAVSGEGILVPGATETIELITDEMPDTQLTLAAMLVNTNDAFTGVTGLTLANLDIGESALFDLAVFDAGTEANLELPGTIPGPADSGVGYDAARDDVNYVARHPGVVTRANGYTDSALDESHRFDAPLARLIVTRVE